MLLSVYITYVYYYNNFDREGLGGAGVYIPYFE
jgi:hypothetical protein